MPDPGPLWNGARTFKGESKTEHSKESSALSVSELSELFQKNFPQGKDRNVLLLSGHGEGSRGTAGYRPQDISRALESSGRQIELSILEGCQTASLEGLIALASQANYALASQLDMDGLGLPWHHLLGNLSQMGEEPKDFATSTVNLVGGLKTVPSLSLIDLKALPQLRASLESLSGELLKAPEEDASIERAVRNATLSRPEGFNSLLKPKRLDLARFLKELEQLPVAPQAQEALEKTQADLQKSILANKSSEAIGGLSIEVPPRLHRRSDAAQTGLKNWSELTP